MKRRLWFGKICVFDNFVRNTEWHTKSLFENKGKVKGKGKSVPLHARGT